MNMGLLHRLFPFLHLIVMIIETWTLPDMNNLPLPSLYHLSSRYVNLTQWEKEKESIAQEVLVFDDEVYELRHNNMSIYWFIDYNTLADINVIQINEINRFLLTLKNITNEQARHLMTRRSPYRTQKYILRNGCHVQWGCGNVYDVSCSKELCLLKDTDYHTITPPSQRIRTSSTRRSRNVDPAGKDYIYY